MTLSKSTQNRARRDNRNNSDLYLTAQKMGVHYYGDCNIENGGYFYKTDDWQEHGYCEAVEVFITENRLFVTVGSINKLRDSKLVGMFETYSADFDGMPADELIHYEIDYSKSYWGIENCSYGKICFAISDCGQYFKSDDGWISVEHLQGWILANYIKAM